MLKVNAKAGEIFIYDTIGADWYGGGITASAIVDALEELGGKRALVRINSPGGVADEGIAIYNALKRYEGGVDTVVDALAASAASVIALAGETRTTSAGGRWMIHRALALSIGNSVEMRKTADILETYDRSLVEIYSGPMGRTEEELLDLMTAETWYTADEAIAAGLSTSKGGSTEAKAMVASWFKNPPQSMLNLQQAELKPNPYPVARQAAKVLSI